MENIERIWNSIEGTNEVFSQSETSSIPVSASKYLIHAIQEGALKAKAVRLFMKGSIKLGKWYGFEAEQVNVKDNGYFWQAKVILACISLKGHDSFINNEAEMKWNLFGILPVLHTTGINLTKSAVGRYVAEAFWLPSLLTQNIKWSEKNDGELLANFDSFGEVINLSIQIDQNGKIESLWLPRWHNYGSSKEYKYIPFGVSVLREKTFGDYTIPSKVRAGWFFGSDRFESEGEFFRTEIIDAKFK